MEVSLRVDLSIDRYLEVAESLSPPAPEPEPGPEPSGKIVSEPGMYWLLPQYEPEGYIGKTLALVLQKQQQTGQHTGYPSTIKGHDNYKINMDEAYQKLWFGLLCAFAPPSMTQAELKRQWEKLTNGHLAFTNGAGSDSNADYINGTLLDKGPMRQETITITRNIVKRAGDPFRSGGEWWLPTMCIDRDQPLPSVEELKDKYWLVHRAMVIRSNQLADGSYMENPFDHLRGNDVPVPWASHGPTNGLPMARLVELPVGSPWPSYYNPPR